MVNKQRAVLGGTTSSHRSQGREGSDSAPRPHNEIVTGRKGKLGCLSPCAGLYPPVPLLLFCSALSPLQHWSKRQKTNT